MSELFNKRINGVIATPHTPPDLQNDCFINSGMKGPPPEVFIDNLGLAALQIQIMKGFLTCEVDGSSH